MSIFSMFMINFKCVQLEALKWVLRYLKDVKSVFSENVIEGLINVYYVRNMDTRKSLFGYVFTLFEIAIYSKTTLQFMMA